MKKNIGVKLTLRKETLVNLTKEAMKDVVGRTTVECESMIFSCKPDIYMCDGETRP